TDAVAPLSLTIGDTDPTLSFTNAISAVSSSSYTGYWSKDPGPDGLQSLDISLDGVKVYVDGSWTTLAEFSLTPTADPMKFDGTFDFGGKAVNFALELHENGTYSLTGGVTQVTIDPTEFGAAVKAAGPTSTYQISYVDAATGETSHAYASVVPAAEAPTSLYGAKNAAGTLVDAFSVAPTGTLVNASSDGIGIGNNVMNSFADKTRTGYTLTTETLRYDPYTPLGETTDEPVNAITLDFKTTGSVGFGTSGARDVVYITLYNPADNTDTKTIMLDSQYGDFLVNPDHTLTPITSAANDYIGGALASYTVATPAGWTGIDFIDVTAGFYNDSNGIPQTSEIKIAFGYSYGGSTLDLPIEMDFTATLVDGDGDSAVSTFKVISVDGTTFNGTDGSDVITGANSGDTLYGGEGNDFLVGGLGDDQLYGDTGADTFVFGSGEGHDTIHDFSIAEGDVLELTDVLDNNLDGTIDGLDIPVTVTGADITLHVTGSAGTTDVTIEGLNTGTTPLPDSSTLPAGTTYTVDDLTTHFTDLKVDINDSGIV
ncbi:MAG: calcium-binding protein, partial [Desulfuromonas sp.]|nr:calcium-binding protein [Desulfuromonas sp.]